MKGLDGNLRGYEPGWLMHGVKRLARLACVAVRTTMGAYWRSAAVYAGPVATDHAVHVHTL